MKFTNGQLLHELEKALNHHNGWVYLAYDIFKYPAVEVLKFYPGNMLIIEIRIKSGEVTKCDVHFKRWDGLGGTCYLYKVENDNEHLQANYVKIRLLLKHFRSEIAIIPELCPGSPDDDCPDENVRAMVTRVLAEWATDFRNGVLPDRTQITNHERPMEIFCAWDYWQLRTGIAVRASSAGLSLDFIDLLKTFRLNDQTGIVYSAKPGSLIFSENSCEITRFIEKVKERSAMEFHRIV